MHKKDHVQANVGHGKRGTKLVTHGGHGGESHAKQPKGRSIGYHDSGAHGAEHHMAGAKSPLHGEGSRTQRGGQGVFGKGETEVTHRGAHFGEGRAGVGMAEHHQRSGENRDQAGHAKQPGGRSIGYHDSGAHGAEHHRGHSMGGSPHSFGHAAHQRSGSLRHSGVAGAHRVGKR